MKKKIKGDVTVLPYRNKDAFHVWWLSIFKAGLKHGTEGEDDCVVVLAEHVLSVEDMARLGLSGESLSIGGFR